MFFEAPIAAYWGDPGGVDRASWSPPLPWPSIDKIGTGPRAPTPGSTAIGAFLGFGPASGRSEKAPLNPQIGCTFAPEAEPRETAPAGAN